MDKSEVKKFLEFCHELAMQRKYAFYLKEDSVWTEKRNRLYQNGGIVSGLFLENNSWLLSLLEQPCNHDELFLLLNRYRNDFLDSPLSKNAKKYGVKSYMSPVEEPLEQWIFDNNYALAYPLSGELRQKDDSMFRNEPEKILSFVYLNLMHYYFEKDTPIDEFSLDNTDVLYKDQFEKSSIYREWGLLPVDSQRKLFSYDDPVRIYDKSLDKTIFLKIQRPLAMLFGELIKRNYITDIAFRADDFYIYDGENHLSVIMEAVETGRVFSLNVNSLPKLSKLYSEQYEDSLWIIHDGNDLTFEELCEDMHIENNAILTQMIHMQIDGNCITHLDHEYIFYDLDEYEKRLSNYRIKGQAQKRIKTFKIDRSRIPLDFPCNILRMNETGREKIVVPFIYFVLNAYFEHKDLLSEYFQKVLLDY